MKLLSKHETENQYPVSWVQMGKGNTKVIYGLEITQFRKSETIEAAHCYAEAIAHSIQCNGDFD